ncbi:SseB family protein [Roseovarius sp. Pro17]|uniref:SseB family protein n=1 Tax=Roseovarius sp. Pro17 TaxID=3108175 RepID=UPI002D784F6F|nr:SseB family protein [Roseovarius sp. Pro17]
MAETALDRAHAVMEAAPEDGAPRLAFYHCLADTQLFVLLTEEPEGDHISPRTFDIEGTSYALAFDGEERLAGFTDGPAPYAALLGRTLAGMLAGAGAGLGLNLEVAPSSILLPPDALDWLVQTLGQGGGNEASTRPESVSAPEGVPQALLNALDAKLARAGGLANHACLAGARYAGGAAGHALFFIGAAPGAEMALTRAVSEALTFSGIEAGALDVGFAEAGSALAQRLERVGLRFDLPQTAAPTQRAAPGSDPDRPPRLK